MLFDEYVHGFDRRYTIIALLAKAGFVPVLIQIALVLLLYTWSTYQAIPPAAPRPPRPREAGERIVTLGRLYENSLPPSAVALRTRNTVVARLAAALGCNKTAVPKAIKALPPAVGAHAGRLLTESNALLASAGRACPHCGVPLPDEPGNQAGVAASQKNASPAELPPATTVVAGADAAPPHMAYCVSCGAPLAGAAPEPPDAAAHTGDVLVRSCNILSETIPITQEIERARRRGR